MPERPRLEVTALAGALLLCAAFLASFLLGIGRSGAPAATVQTRPAITASERPVAGAGRVEVLNASGRGGMARLVTQRLRAAGFDVVYYGNAAASAGDSSVVIARMMSDAVARAAADRLGIERVRTEPDSALFLDATVIIGVDWDAGGPAAGEGESFGARLRRWLTHNR